MPAVVVDAVRTPLAGVSQVLKGWHPVTLLAETLKASTDRLGLDPGRVQRVVAGCATPIGEQAINIARNAVLAAGWPEAVAGSTTDGQALASLFAFGEIVALVQSGAIEIGVAAGVESATRVPDGASSGVAVGQPFGPLVHDRYEAVGGLVAPGRVVEALAAQFGFNRSDLDAYARQSRSRYENARKTGAFKDELHVVAKKNDKGSDTAAHVLEDALVADGEALELLPLFEINGLVTALSFARPADCAAAITVVDSQLADANNWPVLARVVDVRVVGTSPIQGDSGADLAQLVLKRHGLRAADLARVEVHEDSAVTPLALAKRLSLNANVMNPSGGALATGAPLGAIGVTLVTSLVHGLVKTGGRYGLAVIAGAGGMAAVVLLENT